MEEPISNIPQSTLNSITRWMAVQKAAGKEVNPWEYEKLMQAAYADANAKKADMRRLGIAEKGLELKGRMLDETARDNTARYDLGMARIAQGVSEGEKDRAFRGGEGELDRNFRMTMALLNNDFASSQAGLNRAHQLDMFDRGAVAKRGLYDIQSSSNQDLAFYNLIGNVGGFIGGRAFL